MSLDKDKNILKIKEILKDKVVIAPLAGYTNLAFRKIMKEMGASLVFTEMVSAKGLIYENDKTFDYLKTDDFEHPLAVQIFGGNIEEMKKAAEIAGGCHSYVNGENDHRQSQGADRNDSDPQGYLSVLLSNSQHKQPDTGDKKDQGCQYKQYFSNTLHVLYRT